MRSRPSSWTLAVGLMTALSCLGHLGMPNAAHAQAESPSRAPLTMAVCTSPPEDARVAAELCGHLRQQLSQSAALQVVEVDRLLSANDGFDPRESVKALTDQLNEAERLFLTGAMAPAQRSAERALEGLMSMEPWLKDRALLARALRLNLDIKAAIGAPAATLAAAARQMMNLLPERRDQWRAMLQQPAAREALLTAQEQLDAATPGRFELQVDVPRAEIYLDGRFAGVSPLRLNRVSPGEHLIRVRKDGFRPVIVRAVAREGELGFLDVSLTPLNNQGLLAKAVEEVEFEAGQPQAGPAMQELRAILLLDQVVVMRVVREAQGPPFVEAFLYDLRSLQRLAGARRPLTERSFEGHQALAERLLRELTEATRLGADLGEMVGPGEPWIGEDSFLRTWWFWGGVGTATVTAVLLGVLLSRETPEPATDGTLLLSF